MKVLTEFLKDSREYTKNLAAIPFGNSLKMQGESVLQFVNKCIHMLDMWETLAVYLSEVKSITDKWAKEVNKKKVLKCLESSFIKVLVKEYGKLSSVQVKRIKLITSIIVKNLI